MKPLPLPTRISRIAGWLLLALILSSAVLATTTSPRIETAEARRAMALLERAVRHVEAHGEAGVGDFTRNPDFVDHDLYVYALRSDGRFLASGGASAALIGDNVTAQLDLAGRPFFREMIEMARTAGEGEIEYHWFNPADSRGEPKLARFRTVGEIIVAVGYFPPRATEFEARRLLGDAIEALARDEAAALAEFQRLDGRFIRNDLYVFVVDIDDGRFLAHGASPELIGSDGHALRDPVGRAVVSEMLAIAGTRGEGELSYAWRNPTLDRIERKHTFFKRVSGKLVGVGYYLR